MTVMRPTRTHKRSRPGFTLVELLTVIAIIGLLAGILIPTLGGVMAKAKKAKSKAQLSQIKQAIVQFKSTYHYYPLSYDVNSNDIDIELDGKNRDDIEDYLLLPLSARNNNNRKDTKYNRKGITFKEFSDQEFNERGHYIDPFGNTEFHILIDGDNDGSIDLSAIDRDEVRDTVETDNRFIRGKVHLYIYPSDPTALNAQLVTTWGD